MENLPLPTFSDVLITTGSIQLPPHPAKNSPKWPQGMLKYKGRKSKPQQTAFVKSTLKTQKKMVGCLNWVNRPVSLVVIHTNRQIATCFANFGGKFPSVTWSYHHPMKVGEGFRSKSSIAEQHWKPTAKWKQERPTCGCAGVGWQQGVDGGKTWMSQKELGKSLVNGLKTPIY